MAEFFNLFAKFNNEFMGLLFFLMLTLVSGSFFYFIYFRKRFTPKVHEIPESVLDGYIGQKKNLSSSPREFGELDSKSDSYLQAELDRLHEELRRTKTLLDQASNGSSDSSYLKEENERLKSTVSELSENISKMKTSGSSNEGEGSAQLKEENDSLRLQLKEYEVIEDDLASLKQIKDENTRLKELIRGKDLEAEFVDEFSNKIKPEEVDESEDQEIPKPEEENLEISAEVKQEEASEVEIKLADKVSPIEEESSPEVTEIAKKDEEQVEEQETVKNTAAEKNVNEEDKDAEVVELEKDGKEKSADELLSEFEKMLG